MSKHEFFEEENTISAEDEKMDFTGNRKILTQSADPQIQSLYTEWKEGSLIIDPFFQRHFIWDFKKSSRLIESVILQIPLPAIYLSEERDGKTSVIDGQQRLTSFFKFIDDEFPLTDLEVLNYNGKKYRELDKSTKSKIRKGVLRQITFLKNSDPNLKFEIFKRLNSGAMSLNEQEMRNCVYRGEYNNLLRNLSKNKDFRKIMGFTSEPDKRMKDVEYVLRFSAFYFQNFSKYKPPMKNFMDEEMKTRQKISDLKKKELEKVFKNAVASVLTVFGKNSFRRWINEPPKGVYREPKKFSASLFDILMGGFAKTDKGAITRNSDAIREAAIHLMTTDQKLIASITRGTSGKKAVKQRFEIWQKTLEDILGDEEKQPRCFSHELKKEMFNKNSTCSLCKNKITDIDDAALDHIEQYWRGGKTIPENARLTHRHCNATRPRKE